MHCNCQSILNIEKISLIQDLIFRNNIEVVSLNETFLKPKDDFKLNGFNIYRADRIDKRGGGAALAIKKNIISKKIETPPNNELVGVEITTDNNSTLSIFSLYSSPKSHLDFNLLEFIFFNHPNSILLGDLNAKHQKWYCPRLNTKGKLLEAFLSKHNLQVLNSNKITYKRGKSILDLSICSNQITNNFINHTVIDRTIGDHQPTITSFSLNPTRCTKSYTKIISTIDQLEIEADLITKDIQSAIKNSTITYNVNSKCSNPKPIPQFLLKAIKFKNKLRRLYQKSNSAQHKKLFNMVERKIKRQLSNLKTDHFIDELNHISNFNPSNPKHWKTLQNFDQIEHNNEKLQEFKIKNLNEFTTDENTLANLFAHDLESIFNSKNDHEKNTYQTNPTSDTFEKITLKEMSEEIKNLNLKSAPGIDQITNKTIYNLPAIFLPRLLNLFNKSIESEHIPIKWKQSIITMIHKKGKPPDSTSSYRPISLLCCLIKLLERLINNKILIFIEKNNLLPEEQAGFRKKRCTQDHILRLNQSIIQGFNEKKITGAIFFDLEKAFDKVSHQGLIEKLKSIGLNSKL
ncbi:unnamed protein product, partial [Brachionus calyciflorus]